MGSSTRFDDIETEIGACFPIQVAVCVAFSSSVGTPIDLKSKVARLLKSWLSSETGTLNPSTFPTRFCGVHTRFLGIDFSVDPCISENVC